MRCAWPGGGGGLFSRVVLWMRGVGVCVTGRCCFSRHADTVSTATFLVDAQTRHPSTLLLPGVEWTSYSGHAGAIGTSVFVDHKVGVNGVTISSAVAAVHAQVWTCVCCKCLLCRSDS